MCLISFYVSESITKGCMMFSKLTPRYSLVLLLLCIGAGFFFFYNKPSSEEVEYNKLTDVQHASHADYIFLQDGSKQQWIYKQIVESSPDDQMAIVMEVVAADIAEAVDFPINHVKLISGADSFTYRIFNQYPGSLHLKVEGKSVEETSPWQNFDVHQKFRTPFMVASRGPLEPEEIGLRRVIIQNMGKHKDLPKIVALDTYLGNIDRSTANIFYDDLADRFYGIDMGSCLMGNLAHCALEKLEQFSKESISFSIEEIRGLKEYRKALVTLISRFPPKEVIALVNLNLERGGFNPSNPILWNEDAERKLNKWKREIDQNYQDSIVLVEFLKKIDDGQ